jgi:hypothetical protein
MAWKRFYDWSLRPTLLREPTTHERWQIVLWSLAPGIRHHYLNPLTTWLHRGLPLAALQWRLNRASNDWYRVPNQSAAMHIWDWFGVIVVVGDYVRIAGGSLIAHGWMDEVQQCCEFWTVDDI